MDIDLSTSTDILDIYCELFRIQAIFMKDYREFSRNYAVSIMIFMPIVIGFLYNKIGFDLDILSLLIIAFTLGIVTTFIQASFIAEEKERNTLRSLLLSPASLLDILIGISLLVALITIFTLGVSFLIISFVPNTVYIIGILLCILFYCALGIICGLFANSTLEATYTILPVIIIFAFSGFYLEFKEGFPILKVTQWLPSSQLTEIATGNNLATAFIVIILWLVVSWVIAILLCKRRMVD